MSIMYYGNSHIQMYKKPDGILSYKGDVTIWEDKIKSVEIDGITYTAKTGTKEVIIDCMDTKYTRTHVYEYLFKEIGYTFKIEDSVYDMDSFAKCMKDSSSTNSDVARVETAFENKLLHKDIKDVSTYNTVRYGQRNYVLNDFNIGWPYNNSYKLRVMVYEMLYCNRMRFLMMSYGYGNDLYYEIDVKTFIKNIPNLSESNINLFKFLGYHISKTKSEVENGVIIMNALINAKKQAKTYGYETSKH